MNEDRAVSESLATLAESLKEMYPFVASLQVTREVSPEDHAYDGGGDRREYCYRMEANYHLMLNGTPVLRLSGRFRQHPDIPYGRMQDLVPLVLNPDFQPEIHLLLADLVAQIKVEQERLEALPAVEALSKLISSVYN